jgi:predicted transposase YdaD
MNLLKESSFYESILREGRAEGRELGRKEGEKKGEKKGQLKEAQKLLVRVGRIRLGRLDKATRTAIESIDDLDRLERMFVRVHDVSSWADLLAASK